jgi:hypothetical protein
VQASVPIPKFARTSGTLSCELRNQRDTSNLMIPVPLMNPKFAIAWDHTVCDFGFGALVPSRRRDLVHPAQPMREQVQRGLAIAELLQRADRGKDIVSVRTGLTMTLPHVVQLLFE